MSRVQSFDVLSIFLLLGGSVGVVVFAVVSVRTYDDRALLAVVISAAIMVLGIVMMLVQRIRR